MRGSLELSLAQGRLNHLTGGDTREPMTKESLMEAVQAQVEDRQAKIRDIMAEIARLHSLHNSVAPINRLPPELLTNIFSYVLSASDENKDLIRISHTCTHWRAVALGAASLWTRIALNHPEAIDTFLQRSKSLPILFSVTVSHTPVKAVLALITSEINRVRSLKVCVPGAVDLQFVVQRLQVAAPILEELSFENTQLHHKPDRRYPGDPRAKVFDGVPALRSLTLSNVPLVFIPKGPNALTNISLHRKLPKLDVLLDLLESSPHLQSLSLRGTFNGDMAQSDRQLTLSRLASFSMHTFPPQGIASLLSCLALPKDASIAIHAPLDIVDAFEDVFPALPAGPPLALEATSELRRLELLWDDSALTLRAYRGADDFHAPALDISASHCSPHPGRRFLGDWPFDTAHVETLVLCGNPSRDLARDTPVGRERWPAVFAALPALKTLRLMCLGDSTLLHIVATLRGADPQPVPCPQLETLELFDLNPSRRFWGDVLAFALKCAADGKLKKVDLFDVGTKHWIGNVASMLQASGLEVFVDGERPAGEVGERGSFVIS